MLNHMRDTNEGTHWGGEGRTPEGRTPVATAYPEWSLRVKPLGNIVKPRQKINTIGKDKPQQDRVMIDQNQRWVRRGVVRHRAVRITAVNSSRQDEKGQHKVSPKKKQQKNRTTSKY